MSTSAKASLKAELAPLSETKMVQSSKGPYEIPNGAVVIAAITSCTNTSNPSVMIAAGLVAKKALEKGVKVKPWVKTSLAPGSQVVTDYLNRANLTPALEGLGFNLVGYGCTTCIGNSGPLDSEIAEAIESANLTVAGVLSGNRNFEGRIHPQVKLNYLASPPLVVAYALAGSVQIDLMNEPLGEAADGSDVYLKDVWPTNDEIRSVVDVCVTPEMFKERYANVSQGDEEWKKLKTQESLTYSWDDDSTYVKHPPYFEDMDLTTQETHDISGARILALLGDSITTDHISPAGAIKEESPAGLYLKSHGVPVQEFNSYGSRRGNHEVMVRGTFANIRLSNEMTPDLKGGFTKTVPQGTVTTIYDAAMAYKQSNTPLVVIAGKEYGTGSSRDWAAKGTRLLGIKAVITESFERIHRSNLIGMGVLPLEFTKGASRKTLDITGEESISIEGIQENLTPHKKLKMTITRKDGSTQQCELLCRLDTLDEVDYYKNEGILHTVLRRLSQAA